MAMSGVKIVRDDSSSTRVWFCGGFEILRPSTREAVQNTNITISSQVTLLEDGSIVSYPVGRFFCMMCEHWVNIDEHEHAHAARTCLGLCYPSLVCADCLSAPLFNGFGVQFAPLCSDECAQLYRVRMARASAKRYGNIWRKTITQRKERRMIARELSLVLMRHIPNIQVNYILTHIMSFAFQ